MALGERERVEELQKFQERLEEEIGRSLKVETAAKTMKAKMLATTASLEEKLQEAKNRILELESDSRPRALEEALREKEEAMQLCEAKHEQELLKLQEEQARQIAESFIFRGGPKGRVRQISLRS